MKRSKIAFGTCLVLLFGGIAFGADILWTDGAEDQNWHTPESWDTESVPACADTATISDPDLGQPVLTDNGKVTNLEMRAGTDNTDAVELDLNGYKLEVVTLYTVGNSGSTGKSYIGVNNTSTDGSDPGEIVAAQITIAGPSSGGNTTIFSVVPGGTNTTTVKTGTVTGC